MTDDSQSLPPLIIAFVADLMFATQIGKVADHLGYRIIWIENADQVGAAGPQAPTEKPGESLYGREGQLFDQITGWRPALLLFDLTNTAVPWQTWIPALKSSPATCRVPIMCFGPHEDVATMRSATELGAEAVLARSRFMADMPILLARYIRLPDNDAIRVACREPLSDLARKGIALFNEGAYYKCHDALEEAWMGDRGPGRDLYRGILQIGIAYYQIERGNYRGAVKMLLRVRQWLGPLPATCRGVDVARLRQDAEQVYTSLVALGPERVSDFDRRLFHPIQLI